MSHTDHLYVAIMAGGAGTRFWPKSKSNFPKQFLDVMGTKKTLLQTTFDRALSLVDERHILVLTHQQYTSIVREQLPSLPPENILSEPLRKNTAPALTFLTYMVNAKDSNALLIALPSDHRIGDEREFAATLRKACDFARYRDALLTLGIVPTSPHTGYGYIQKGDPVLEEFSQIFKVRTFTEKPPLELAHQFLESKEFFWNAGVFVWSTASAMKAINTHMPQEAEAFNDHFAQYVASTNCEEKSRILKLIFEQCRNISIDYALFEHANNVHVVASSFDWNDLGSWTGVYELRNKDQHLNVCNQEKSTILLHTKGCLIDTPAHKLALIDGLEDFVIVDTPDALMICKKANAQKIKDYLDLIKEKGYKDYL